MAVSCWYRPHPFSSGDSLPIVSILIFPVMGLTQRGLILSPATMGI